MVDGERILTRYGETGDAVRKLVCEKGKAKRKWGKTVACAPLDPRALHKGVGDEDEVDDSWY
jgi:hypothetical protein